MWVLREAQGAWRREGYAQEAERILRSDVCLFLSVVGYQPCTPKETALQKMKPLNRKHLAQEAEQTSKVLHWPRKPAGHGAWALERKTLKQLGHQQHLRSRCCSQAGVSLAPLHGQRWTRGGAVRSYRYAV